MPHECTNCGRTFPDGSKEMLSGCPDCGGNKFQFAPNATAAQSKRAGNAGTATNAQSADRSAPDPEGRTTSTTGTQTAPDSGSKNQATPNSESTDESGVATRAAETVRDWVSSDSDDARSGTGREAHSIDNSQSVADIESPTDSPAAVDSDPSTDMDEFSEWPDTARRPEDRSDATDATDTDIAATDAPSVDTTADPDRPTDTASSSSSTHTDPGTSSAADQAASSSLDSDTSVVPDDEDTAQADARSEVVSRDDLPSEPVRSHDGADATDLPPQSSADGDAQPPDHGRVVSEPSAEQPSIEDLRAELNEQFESIKIVNPGQYELNLMELYNREEYIISLQEDGRYVIDVPDSWRGDDTE